MHCWEPSWWWVPQFQDLFCTLKINWTERETVDQLKPSYFKKQPFYHHFYLPEVNIQVQNGHKVLGRLVSCISEMGLAYWVLYDHFRYLYLLQVSKNDDEKRCFLKNLALAASCQKVQKSDFQSQFSNLKMMSIFPFFFHWKISISAHIFGVWHFLATSIIK